MSNMPTDDYPKAGAKPKPQAYPTVVQNKDGTLTHVPGQAPAKAPSQAAPRVPPAKEASFRQALGLPAGTVRPKLVKSAPAGEGSGAQPAAAQGKGHFKTPADRAAYDKQYAELKNQHYEPPVKVPTVTAKDLMGFDESLVAKVSNFEDKLRSAGDTDKAKQARAAFVASMQPALLTYKKAAANFQVTLAEMHNTSDEGKNAGRDADSAAFFINAAWSHFGKGEYAISIGLFRDAHKSLRSAKEWGDMAFKDNDASLARYIDILQKTRIACEGALTVLGAGLEAGAFKVVMALVPALARGAEKASNAWNGIRDDMTWGEIIGKGLIDGSVAHLSNVFDKRYFDAIDYGKAFKITDPNTLLFIGKNTYAITMGIAKECWQRMSSGAIRTHYGEPPEKLTDGIMEAMWAEYSKDSGGTIFFKALEEAGHVMPK